MAGPPQPRQPSLTASLPHRLRCRAGEAPLSVVERAGLRTWYLEALAGRIDELRDLREQLASADPGALDAAKRVAQAPEGIRRDLRLSGGVDGRGLAGRILCPDAWPSVADPSRAPSCWWTTVIVLTAETDVLLESKLTEEGADDYLSKPFDPRVFGARVRATIRRAAGASA